jgi:hypothetical protein
MCLPKLIWPHHTVTFIRTWLGIALTVISVALSIIVFVLGIRRGVWSGKLS